MKYLFIIGFAAFAGLFVEPVLLPSLSYDARLLVTVAFSGLGLFVGQKVEKKIQARRNGSYK